MNEALIAEIELLRPKKHNPYHDGKLGCWDCLREEEYNKAVDDVIELIKSHDDKEQ